MNASPPDPRSSAEFDRDPRATNAGHAPDRQRLRVAVIYGGRSAEHEISLISARFVAANLDPARFDVLPIGIARDGRWLLPEGGRRALQAETLAGAPVTAEADRQLVRSNSGGPAAGGIDVVFPVLHGPYGEDGTVQGLLELAGIPYVGAGVLGSSLGMDKIAQKEVLRAHGIPTARFAAVRRTDWERHGDAVIEHLEATLRYPVFVKPSNLGSSVGISKAHDRKQLEAALANAGEYDRRLIVEESLEGAREVECAVLGNDDPQVSVIGEIRTRYEFYDYEAKYLDEDGAELVIPAELPAPVTERVRDLARRTFIALDCAGMARIDFFTRDTADEVWVNEINTIPGFTPISMYPRLWEASGIPPQQLIERLVELAMERHAERRQLKVTR